MPLLNHSDLAKELIRRRNQRAAPAPARRPLGEVDANANETTSYEMVEPELEGSAGIKRGKKSWLLQRRAGRVVDQQEKRVVSEPVVGMRGGMLSRLRLRRGSEDMFTGRDVSLDTESTGVDVLDTSDGSSRSMKHESMPPSSFVEAFDSSYDTGPSFIAFSPATTSSSSSDSPTHSLRPPPRPAHSASSRRTLAPVLATPAHSLKRAAATRAITLEARLYPDTSQASQDTQSTPSRTFEYPSEADMSGLRGILRAKHSRVPPNTPVPSVRFADTRLQTPILTKQRYSKTRSPGVQEEGDSLPAAQISSGPRWKRLGALLSAVDGDEPSTPVSPAFSVRPRESCEPRSRSLGVSSSDSPISFARFDPSDVLCSTPIRRARPRQPIPILLGSPPPSSDDTPPTPDTPTSSLMPDLGELELSPSDDELFEGCSALEALWEYGSSDGEGSELDLRPVRPATPVLQTKDGKEVSDAIVNLARTSSSEFPGSDYHDAGNEDLGSDPFPFAP